MSAGAIKQTGNMYNITPLAKTYYQVEEYLRNEHMWVPHFLPQTSFKKCLQKYNRLLQVYDNGHLFRIAKYEQYVMAKGRAKAPSRSANKQLTKEND